MPRRILFVCTGNTCRSPMAEVLANYFGRGKLEAWSEGHGGSRSDEIHPLTVAVLARAGVPRQDIVRNAHDPPESFDEIIVFDDIGSTENSKRTRRRYQTAVKRYELSDPYQDEKAYNTTYMELRDILRENLGINAPPLPPKSA